MFTPPDAEEHIIWAAYVGMFVQDILEWMEKNK